MQSVRDWSILEQCWGCSRAVDVSSAVPEHCSSSAAGSLWRQGAHMHFPEPSGRSEFSSYLARDKSLKALGKKSEPPPHSAVRTPPNGRQPDGSRANQQLRLHLCCADGARCSARQPAAVGRGLWQSPQRWLCRSRWCLVEVLTACCWSTTLGSALPPGAPRANLLPTGVQSLHGAKRW